MKKAPIVIPPGFEELIDVPALAKVLKTREAWVYQHLDDVPHVRIGRHIRFEPEAIRRYIAEQTRGPGSNGDG